MVIKKKLVKKKKPLTGDYIKKGVVIKKTDAQWKKYLQDGQKDIAMSVLEQGKRIYEFKQTCDVLPNGHKHYTARLESWLTIKVFKEDFPYKLNQPFPQHTHNPANKAINSYLKSSSDLYPACDHCCA